MQSMNKAKQQKCASFFKSTFTTLIYTPPHFSQLDFVIHNLSQQQMFIKKTNVTLSVYNFIIFIHYSIC